MFRALSVLVLVALSAGAHAGDVQSTRILKAGTVLAPGDLVAGAGAAPTDIDALIGLEVRKTIYAGRPVTQGDLGPPTLVHRNDVVVMSYAVGGLDLRTEGRALGAGGIGERIDVMNLDTRLTVRATVAGRQHVRVE